MWFETLKDLTPRALDNGLETLRCASANSKFIEYPPNPMQFRVLCLSYYDALRLPAVSDAYQTFKTCVRLNNWQDAHPVLKYTAYKLGDDYLKIEADFKTYPVFKEAYQKVCHMAHLGMNIPDVTITTFLPNPSSPATAKRHLAQLKQQLGMLA